MSVVFLREVDDTGSLHVCAQGDPDAMAFTRQKFWPESWRLARAQRLVSEASKIYRLDKPSPATVQSYLDEADELLRELMDDVEQAEAKVLQEPPTMERQTDD